MVVVVVWRFSWSIQGGGRFATVLRTRDAVDAGLAHRVAMGLVTNKENGKEERKCVSIYLCPVIVIYASCFPFKFLQKVNKIVQIIATTCYFAKYNFLPKHENFIIF